MENTNTAPINSVPTQASSTTPVASPASSSSKTTTTMWDAFEHILMFISLYVLATSIALTLYFFVDKWLPAVTSDYYRSYNWENSRLDLLRGYLAALIVSLPLFVFFFLHVTKRTIQNSNMRNIKSRKILIYITLVVAFIIMLFNIISTVYNFLRGNITLNFFLHLVVTLSVTGIIFVYYLFQVKEDRKLNA